MKLSSRIHDALTVATLLFAVDAAMAFAALAGRQAYDQPGDKNFVSNTAVLDRWSPGGGNNQSLKINAPRSQVKALFAVSPLVVDCVGDAAWDDATPYPGAQRKIALIPAIGTPKHQIGSYDEVLKMIEMNSGQIVTLDCVCRAGTAKQGQPCKQTSRTETCMALGEAARLIARSAKLGRVASNEEALDILQKNQDEGLVLQPSYSQHPETICSCCGCCCGLCTGYCPEDSLELRHKSTQTVPATTQEDMMEHIMSNKI